MTYANGDTKKDELSNGDTKKDELLIMKLLIADVKLWIRVGQEVVVDAFIISIGVFSGDCSIPAYTKHGTNTTGMFWKGKITVKHHQ